MKTILVILSMAAIAIRGLLPHVASAQYSDYPWAVTNCSRADSPPGLRGSISSDSRWGVLQGFAAWYGDMDRSRGPKVEDHKLYKLAIEPPPAQLGGSGSWLSLMDASGYDKHCGWVMDTGDVAEDRSLGEMVKECQGAGFCDLTIDAPPRRGSVFALKGFSFWVGGHGENDRNIRTIEISPDVGNKRVRVRFADNGGFNYFAHVYYTYLSPEAVAGQYRVSGSRTSKTPVLRLRRQAGRAVLQGFRFSFRNGDHYFGMMQILPVSHLYEVAFRDKNLDDDFDVSIQYAILR